MAFEPTRGMNRRGLLAASGGLAAMPLLGTAAASATARPGADGIAAAVVSGRRKLGSLEVSSVGLGVQNMSRTYQMTIPTRPEMLNIIRTASPHRPGLCRSAV